MAWRDWSVLGCFNFSFGFSDLTQDNFEFIVIEKKKCQRERLGGIYVRSRRVLSSLPANHTVHNEFLGTLFSPHWLEFMWESKAKMPLELGKVYLSRTRGKWIAHINIQHSVIPLLYSFFFVTMHLFAGLAVCDLSCHGRRERTALVYVKDFDFSAHYHSR